MSHSRYRADLGASRRRGKQPQSRSRQRSGGAAPMPARRFSRVGSPSRRPAARSPRDRRAKSSVAYYAVARGRNFGPDETRKLPLARRLVVAQNEQAAVVDLHLEVTMCGMEPAVEQIHDLEAALAEPERARFLLAAVAGVAFDVDLHRYIIVH